MNGTDARGSHTLFFVYLLRKQANMWPLSREVRQDTECVMYAFSFQCRFNCIFLHPEMTGRKGFFLRDCLSSYYLRPQVPYFYTPPPTHHHHHHHQPHLSHQWKAFSFSSVTNSFKYQTMDGWRRFILSLDFTYQFCYYSFYLLSK